MKQLSIMGMKSLAVIIMSVFFPLVLVAQKNKKEEFKFKKLANITVDGNLSEWSTLDTLEGNLWSFGVSVIEGRLYAAVQVKDELLQKEALQDGIFLNISYNDKKKDGAMLIFPAIDRERLRALRQDEERNIENFKQDFLTSVRGYYVMGFSRLVDGLLAFDNDYGVEAKAIISEEGSLLYEAVVPLDLIALKGNEIAVQIGVRTRHYQLQKAAANRTNTMNSNMRVYGRPMMQPTVKSPYEQRTDIWLIDKVK